MDSEVEEKSCQEKQVFVSQYCEKIELIQKAILL